MKPNKFYIMATDGKLNQGGPKIVCHRGTFFRRLNKYQVHGILPDKNDYGLRMGAPPIISKEKVTNLNKELKEYKGFAESNVDLSKSLVKISESKKRERGDYGHRKAPCAATVQFYQMLSTELDNSIIL